MGKPEKNGTSKAHYLPTPEISSSDRDMSDMGDEAERAGWGNKMDFILSCLSYAVGLGNVWRFPYVCYKNGGGAFLIPFFIMLFVCGIPLVFLELSFGQYASSGPVSIWAASPIFQGVGWAMFIVSSLIAVYYSMIIAWTIYYFFASFSSELPWSKCGDWASDMCLEDQSVQSNCTVNNGTWFNFTCFHPSDHNVTYYNHIKILANDTKHVYKSSSDEYFHRVVLEVTDGIDTIGGLRWELVGCLVLAWVLVCLCLSRGIKSSGKAVWFTALFPYVVLTILFVRGLMLEGAANGVAYYLTPQWELLADPKVWRDGAVQIFFSLGPGWGGLITLASYNKFNNNSMKDAILVSVLDCLTSVFGGMVIFSIIGYMAHVLHADVDTVASDGPGLAFVAYPYVVTKLPFSQLWAVLFFSMLIALGLGTQIATVTTVHTTLIDQFPSLFSAGKRSFCLLMAIASMACLIGFSFCTQGGIYVVQLFDNYAATYSLLTIGMVESIALAYVYGWERFFDDIEQMMGKRPHVIWKWCWKVISPVALFCVLVFNFVDFQSTRYESYIFPGWADGVGSLLSLPSIMAIPIVALWKFIMAYRNSSGEGWKQVLKDLSKPTASWGPKNMKSKGMAMSDMKPANGASCGAQEAMVPKYDEQYC